jgi:transposase
MKFCNFGQNLFGKNIKTLDTKKGREFKNHVLKGFLEEKEIKHTVTLEGAPQTKGVCEQCNLTLLNSVRAMLYSACLALRLWKEIATAIVNTKNIATHLYREFTKTKDN